MQKKRKKENETKKRKKMKQKKGSEKSLVKSKRTKLFWKEQSEGSQSISKHKEISTSCAYEIFIKWYR